MKYYKTTINVNKDTELNEWIKYRLLAADNSMFM